MRITQIEVAGLFGVFNHTIPLNTKDHITIIHGPNGLGKTILLKMVNGIFNSRYSLLRAVPFKKLRVCFDDGSSLETTRVIDHEKSKKRRPHDAVKLQFSLVGPGHDKKFFTSPSLELVQGMPVVEALDRFVPVLTRVGHDAFRNIETGDLLTLEDAMARYGDHISHYFHAPPEETWFVDLKKGLSVHLIDTDRLAPFIHREKESRATRQQGEVRPAVVRHSNEIAKRIQERLAESAALTQALDRTFPARLVQQGTTSEMTADEVRNKLSQLEERRGQLRAVGLLDKADDMPFQVPTQLDASTKGVLSVYVQDVEKKLGIFDDLAARITLFQKLINGRFLYKSMSVSKDRGFVFSSTDGTTLSPSDLSSGEQHELVLFYELLFRVQPQSLIMVDEPELSLHVAWQEQFLKDLHSITQLTAFDVLIATHSPQIIHDRWDLTVELSGPAK